MTSPKFSDTTTLFPAAGADALPARALRIKFGVDPTSPNLHLGHSVALRQLRNLQEQGHTVLLVIGDFTAAIGDPTGRNTTRPALTAQAIEHNALTYLDQVFLFLNPEQTEVHWNSKWLGQLSAAEMVRLTSRATVAQMSQRNDFAKRLESGTPISLHEFIYPLLQGYDSVHLKCDVEIGGSDQTFNLMMGRSLQGLDGQPPQLVGTVPLLVGLDGERKMSKSFNNDIGLREPLMEQLAKLMKLPDAQIRNWGELLTNTPVATWDERLAQENPRQVKLDMARTILRTFHDKKLIEEAIEGWGRAVCFSAQASDLEPEVLSQVGPASLMDVLVRSGLCTSRSNARQKIDEGAVWVDGIRVVDRQTIVPEGFDGVLQVGKRNFKRISLGLAGSTFTAAPRRAP